MFRSQKLGVALLIGVPGVGIAGALYGLGLWPFAPAVTTASASSTASGSLQDVAAANSGSVATRSTAANDAMASDAQGVADRLQAEESEDVTSILQRLSMHARARSTSEYPGLGPPVPHLPEHLDGEQARVLVRNLAESPETLEIMDEQQELFLEYADYLPGSRSHYFYAMITDPALTPPQERRAQAESFDPARQAPGLLVHTIPEVLDGQYSQEQLKEALEVFRGLCGELHATCKERQKELGIADKVPLESMKERVAQDRAKLEMWKEIDQRLLPRFAGWEAQLQDVLNPPQGGGDFLDPQRLAE